MGIYQQDLATSSHPSVVNWTIVRAAGRTPIKRIGRGNESSNLTDIFENMPQTDAEFFLQPHDTEWHIPPVLGIGSPHSRKTAWLPATPSGHKQKTGETLFAVGSPTGSNSPSRAQRILANSISR